jgi:hypothetical protein
LRDAGVVAGLAEAQADVLAAVDALMFVKGRIVR